LDGTELARDALLNEGYYLLGGYMSPVGDAYDKKGLAPAEHRIKMCQLATQDSPFVMVDPWEVSCPIPPGRKYDGLASAKMDFDLLRSS
jgi:nicotinic acid mononucleotide adenylyltransferase